MIIIVISCNIVKYCYNWHKNATLMEYYVTDDKDNKDTKEGADYAKV